MSQSTPNAIIDYEGHISTLKIITDSEFHPKSYNNPEGPE